MKLNIYYKVFKLITKKILMFECVGEKRSSEDAPLHTKFIST